MPIRRLIDFADTCVFAKQSLGPILCGLLQLKRAKRSHLPQAPLLPKLRGHFAEFLLHGSLEHLRLLASPTCVGLRYGHRCILPAEAFLGGQLRETLGRCRRPPSASGLSYPRSFISLDRLPPCTGTSSTRRLFASASPLRVKRTSLGTGILTRFPSSTPFGLDLGAD